MDNEILVSVICITYNQEKYIKRCVDSLINQHTTFRYEVIVHDDKSTDMTIDILKECKQEYGENLILYLEDENQYSKGINIIDDILYPKTKGKYIAICEGDDYWTDKYKLQKQVNALENNPECWISAHEVGIVNELGNQIKGKLAPCNENCIFSVNDVIDGDGGFVGTNSLLIKREAFENKYEFRSIYPLDYFLQIMGSLHGGMLYLSQQMSVYRAFSKGSWTENNLANRTRMIEHYNKIIKALEKCDLETDKKYHSNIYNSILRQRIKINILEDNYAEIINNKEMMSLLSFKEKIKYIYRYLFK